MSTTLQISNGDLFIDRSTGTTQSISGTSKLAQDIAEALLVNFDLERNFGNTMNVDGIQPSIIGQVSEVDVRERIESAIDRLKNKQAEDDQLDPTEELVNIERLDIELLNGNTEVRFLLEVSTAKRERVNVGDTLTLKPTQLKHVNPPGTFLLNEQGNPLEGFIPPSTL